MTAPRENANLIDNEDPIGDAEDLPRPSAVPVNSVNSINAVTLAQQTSPPLSPPTETAAAPRSGSPNSSAHDPSTASINTSDLMSPGRSAKQTSGTSPSVDSESQTEPFFYLTTSASPFVRRSSLSHPSLIIHPSTSQPASSTTHSSPSFSQSTSSRSQSSRCSPPSNLLPLAAPFQPASQSPPSSGLSPATFPLVTLASVRKSTKVSITEPAVTVSTAAMPDTTQQVPQPAVQATPPKAQVSESPAQTPSWVCQTPVWVTAPEGVGMATPSPTLSSFQAPPPGDTATSPKGVMSFNVPSPIKSVGDGSPSPIRTAFSFGSSMPAVFQPASSAPAFDKSPASKAVPITKPVPKAFTCPGESVSLLGDIPEAEDLLTEDDSNGTTLADQLSKARVLSAAPSSQASSTDPAELRPTHTPLERNLYDHFETKIESKETPVLVPKSTKYGNISLAASMTGSSVGQSTLVGDNPLRLPSESEGPKRSASAASLSSTPGKEVSVKALAAMYDHQAGKSGRSAVTPGFSDDTAQAIDDAETVTGNESDTKDNTPSATLRRFSEKGFGTEPLAIAAPGFRPQSSVYDADNDTDTEASAGRCKDTDTETEAPKPKSRKLAKDGTPSADSATLDDITGKPFVPTVIKPTAAKPEVAATGLAPASNGLEEGKAEVEELDRLWTDFKDGVAVFGGGIDEVIARLNKEFKNHKCSTMQIAAVAPAAPATAAVSAAPAVDVKALEIKRQEFDDLRRKSEALRARALKAEGEAREAADRTCALEAEVDAAKKKSEAAKDRIDELTGLYDSSESLCSLLRKRNQSIGTDFVTLEDTHRQLEADFNKLKEEMKETHGFVAVFMEGEGRMFDPEELARGYDGGSKWASRIRSETVRLCRLMNNDTEVPVLMYLYFDIQKTLTELLQAGSIKDIAQFDDFMEGFSSTEDLITVSDVSGAVGASVKMRAKMKLMSGFRACRLIYLVAGKDKGYVKDIMNWPKSAQTKVFAARSTGADEADKDPFLELGNDHLFYAGCFFPRTFDQWSNEIRKTGGQLQASEGAAQQPQSAAAQQHLGQGAPTPQQQLQTQQLAPETTPNPGPLDPNHTGLTARPGAFAGLQQPLNPTQYSTPPPQSSYTPLAPSQSSVAPMQPQQQPPPQGQTVVGWGQTRSATYSHSYLAPPQGPPQGAPQERQQTPHGADWGQRSASWSQPPQQQQQQAPPQQQQQAPPQQQQQAPPQRQQQTPPQQWQQAPPQQQQAPPQQWQQPAPQHQGPPHQQPPPQQWQQGPPQQSQQPVWQQPQQQQPPLQQHQQQPPPQQQQGWGQQPAHPEAGWHQPAPQQQWQPQGGNQQPPAQQWGQPPLQHQGQQPPAQFQAQPQQPQQAPQQQHAPQQQQPQQPAQSQQPPWNQYGAAPPAQPQQPQKQPSPAAEHRQSQARRYNKVTLSHRRGYAGSIGGSPPSTDEDNPLLKDVPQTSRTFVSRPPQFARPEDPVQRPGSSNSLISMVSSAVHGRGAGPPPTFRVRDVSQPHNQPAHAPHAPQPADVKAPPPWTQNGGVAQKLENNAAHWRL